MNIEITRKMLLAYDPDYTKLLPHEEKAVQEALYDFENGVNISDGTDINW